MTKYMSWLQQRTSIDFSTYDDLWRWSVSDLDAFWRSVWDFFEVRYSGDFEHPLGAREMPGAEWFSGARLSFVEHVLRNARRDRPAVLWRSENGERREVGWDDLAAEVAAVAAWLREHGVGEGDRVVGYMPNVPETVIACLAVTSLGAIWSSCSPDFGSKSVVDRFHQIAPKVLFACDGYRYGGRTFDRLGVLSELEAKLPTLEHVVLLPILFPDSPDAKSGKRVRWEEVTAKPAQLELPRFDFSHPLWIVYTSGTTGLPKPIVHSQGGVLLEMLKASALHLDLGPGDVFFWFTTTGWIMWNLVLSALLTGATIVLYDGSPGYPDLDSLWRMADEFGVTFFGTSAAFVTGCAKAGLAPGRDHDLSRVRTIGSTGSPLSADACAWVYEKVKHDVWLASMSGGTDVGSAFVGGCPLLPVHAGEMQCRYLGVDAQAFDPDGRSLTGEVGELVITQPMPSMPLYFWNDVGNSRYLDSYFRTYPGVWRHGDFVMITERGTVIIYGRSDSTINRAGIRIGTSDIYEVVDAMPEIADSLVVDVDIDGDRTEMLLFVVLADGRILDRALVDRTISEIRRQLSPRHVPDEVIAVPEIPRTLNGKKLEVPVKRLLMGMDPNTAVSAGATVNPDALDYFVQLGRERSSRRAGVRPS